MTSRRSRSGTGEVSMRNSSCLGATICVCCGLLHIAPQLGIIFLAEIHMFCVVTVHSWERGRENWVAFRILILNCASSAQICIDATQRKRDLLRIFLNNWCKMLRINTQSVEFRKKSELRCNMQYIATRKFAHGDTRYRWISTNQSSNNVSMKYTKVSTIHKITFFLGTFHWNEKIGCFAGVFFVDAQGFMELENIPVFSQHFLTGSWSSRLPC